MLHALPVLDWLLESFVCCVMACAQQNDSTLIMQNKLAEWDAPMSQIVSFTTTGVLLSFCTILRDAGVHRREHQLFHFLITQTPLRSLQYAIAVMGIIDAFVYAHNYHRHNIDNPGKGSPPDGYHPVRRPFVQSPLSHKTPV